MSRLPRVLALVGVTVAALVVGILLGRLVRGEPDEAPAAAAPAPAPAIAADDATAYLLRDEFTGTGAADPAGAAPGDDGVGDGDPATRADLLTPPDRTVPLLAARPAPDLRTVDDGDRLEVVAAADDAALGIGSGGVQLAAGSTTNRGAVGVIGPPDEPPDDLTTVEPDALIGATPVDDPVPPPPLVQSSAGDPAPVVLADIDGAVAPDAADEATDTAEEAGDGEDESPRDPGPASGIPLVNMPDLGVWMELPPIEFDPCAGPAPGEPSSSACPDGIAGTLAALNASPPPYVVIVPGHATDTASGMPSCPADTPAPATGERAFTIWSHGPLASANLTYRPYGSDLMGEFVSVSSTDEQTAAWFERFEAEPFDRSWGLVPTCGVITAGDAGVAYEISGVATDAFDRTINIGEQLLPSDTPTERPPLATRMYGIAPTVEVTTWIADAEDVEMRIVQGRLGAPDATCDGAPTLRTNATGRRPVPDVYDPVYGTAVTGVATIPTGQRAVVCVTISDGDGPLLVERVMFEAPRQSRPRVVLRRIDTRDGDRIEPIVVATGAYAGGPSLGDCDRRVSIPEIPDDQLTYLWTPIWECGSVVHGLDGSGRLSLPFRIERGRQIIIDAAIPIDAPDCTVELCPRRSDYVRVPIVAPGQDVCWTRFGELCDPDADVDIDGEALIEIRYDIVTGEGGLDGRTTVLDAVDPRYVAATPRFTRPVATTTPGSDPFHWDATFRTESDRPVRAGFELVALPGADGACPPPAPSPLSDESATTFEFTFTDLCTGGAYAIVMHAADETGAEWRVDTLAGYALPAGPVAEFDVDLVVDGPGGVGEALFVTKATLAGPLQLVPGAPIGEVTLWTSGRATPTTVPECAAYPGPIEPVRSYGLQSSMAGDHTFRIDFEAFAIGQGPLADELSLSDQCRRASYWSSFYDAACAEYEPGDDTLYPVPCAEHYFGDPLRGSATVNVDAEELYSVPLGGSIEVSAGMRDGTSVIVRLTRSGPWTDYSAGYDAGRPLPEPS